MDLYHRVEQIIAALRPVFRRQAAFEWFVLVLLGVLLSTQPPAITSYLNAIAMHPHPSFVELSYPCGSDG